MAAEFLVAAPPGAAAGTSQSASAPMDSDLDCADVTRGSPYIPVDSWVYPAILRLYSLGYIDTVYLDMRPWTRTSVSNMLDETEQRLEDAESDEVSDVNEAEHLYDALKRKLRDDVDGSCKEPKGTAHLESVYSVMRGISGTPLRDSYHLGATIINDYGRPYAGGVNNYTGASGYASAGRFVLYARAEFNGAPSAPGYSPALVEQLAAEDGTSYYFNPICWLNPSSPSCVPMPNSLQTTIPVGPVVARTNMHLMEAYVSAQYFHHVISFGKQDDWEGPGVGGAFAYSNNAENIYAFHINRIEPLNIPLLSSDRTFSL